MLHTGEPITDRLHLKISTQKILQLEYLKPKYSETQNIKQKIPKFEVVILSEQSTVSQRQTYPNT